MSRTGRASVNTPLHAHAPVGCGNQIYPQQAAEGGSGRMSLVSVGIGPPNIL